MDVAEFTTPVTRVMLDAVDDLQSVAYTTGNGTNPPQGIITRPGRHGVGDQHHRL